MDIIVCSQCGLEIEGKGIHFRKRHFCSDECCEEFEAVAVEGGEPDDLDLTVDDDDLDDDDLDDDDLGYRGDSDDDDDFLDDDFDIRPEDF
jgi:hypothetical protein